MIAQMPSYAIQNRTPIGKVLGGGQWGESEARRRRETEDRLFEPKVVDRLELVIRVPQREDGDDREATVVLGGVDVRAFIDEPS